MAFSFRISYFVTHNRKGGNNLYCTIAPSRHNGTHNAPPQKAMCRVFVSRAPMGWSLACQVVSEPTNQSFQRVFIRNNRLGDTHTRYNQATNQRGQSADNHARIITRWHNHKHSVAFTRYQSVPSVSLARVSVSLCRGRLPLMQRALSYRIPPPYTARPLILHGVIPTTYRTAPYRKKG